MNPNVILHQLILSLQFPDEWVGFIGLLWHGGEMVLDDCGPGCQLLGFYLVGCCDCCALLPRTSITDIV